MRAINLLRFRFVLVVIIVLIYDVLPIQGENQLPLLRVPPQEITSQSGTAQFNAAASLPLNFTLEEYPEDILEEMYASYVTNEGVKYPSFITTSENFDFMLEYGIHVNSILGQIHTANLSVDQMVALEDDSRVLSIAPSVRCYTELDVSLPDMKVTNAWSSFSVNGDSVIIGIIDDGIDLTNPDFMDSTGLTRVLYLWDQTDTTGYLPSGYSYGSECSKNDIDAGTCGFQNLLAGLGNHGTAVAGVASGNGQNDNAYVPVGKYTGVAPGASIIFVKRTDFSTQIVDAAKYIADKAVSLGLPWVINMSFGSLRGPHDGTSPFETAIGAVRNQYSGGGNVLVKSAGNDNYEFFDVSNRRHQNHTLSVGPGSVTLEALSSISVFERIFIDIWYPSIDPYWVSVITPRGDTVGPFGPNSGTGPPGFGYVLGKDTNNPSNSQGLVILHNDHWNSTGRYSDPFPSTPDGQIVLVLADKLSSGYWFHMETGDWQIVMDSGSGRWEAYIWSQYTVGGISAFDLADYDNSRKITEPGNAENIITVGSYNTKPFFINYSQDTVYARGWKAPSYWFHREQSPFSSRGPTRDGRPKPEVLAPGSIIVSSFDSSGAIDTKVLQGFEHRGAEGTSFAAPHVTGLVALMLDLNPNFTFEQIRDCLVSNVDPYGRVNALDAVRCAKDAINDEVAIVIPEDFNILQNYPNPFNGNTMINFHIPAVDDEHTHQRVRLEVFNILGQLVKILKDENMKPGEYAVSWDATDRYNNELPSGIYLARCNFNGTTLTNKMVYLK